MEYKVTGRGGTAFTPVINYLNNDKNFRDALLIYFTDGYGESEIPKPLIFKLLWVIIGKNNELGKMMKFPFWNLFIMMINILLQKIV